MCCRHVHENSCKFNQITIGKNDFEPVLQHSNIYASINPSTYAWKFLCPHMHKYLTKLEKNDVKTVYERFPIKTLINIGDIIAISYFLFAQMVPLTFGWLLLFA